MDNGAIFGGIALAALTVYGYSRMLSKGKTQEKLKEILKTATVIDVRSAAEFRSGHFSGAINVPVDKITKKAGVMGDKKAPKIVYCASGSRARQAIRAMKGMGFSSVHFGGSRAQMEKLV